MGWASDAGLMAYHTQHICKNRDDMAEALENKEVTTVPRKWPCDREPQPLRHAAERMVTLGEWLRGGVIDDAEYKAKKQKIIDDL